MTAMNINEEIFGIMPDGKQVKKYTINNGKMSFSVIEYGAIIQSINVPNNKGILVDVALGFDTLSEYIEKNASFYFGAIIGRFANRIANAKFTLDNRSYQLDQNDNGNCLHGGSNGYDRMVWNSQIVKDERGCGVKFSRTSVNGEQGFPGNLKLEIYYILTDNNELLMEYFATTDKKTPINITNHSYFNLCGNGNGTIKNHMLKIDGKKYLTVDSKLIPDGVLQNVKHTAFDFTKPKKIGQDIDKVGMGYDHCYVLSGDVSKPCAIVEEKSTGIKMEVYTDQIGVQFYAGNFLDNLSGKNGKVYNKHEGFCLETQRFPDAPNQKDFPNCYLDVGKEYRAKTIYKFYN